jgi:hypothetical protein
MRGRYDVARALLDWHRVARAMLQWHRITLA